MDKEENTRSLSKEVAEEFKIEEGHPWKFAWRQFDLVDFTNMTLAQARAYYDAGVPGLIKKSGQTKASSSGASSPGSQGSGK